MAKKTTLDDLALAVAKGFEGVHDRLDQVDGRLDGIDGRLDGIDGRLDALGKDMKQVKYDVNEMHMKLPYFAYAMDVKDLRERVDRLEKKLGLE